MTTLEDIEPHLWFADTETYAYDNVWVLTRYGTGEQHKFVNGSDELEAFIAWEQPILCGYNIHGYDIHILKGALAGFPNSTLKAINDTIIFGGEDKYEELWRYFDNVWVDVPYYIDLFHDIVPRRSLKVLEGNLGLSVEESDVDFDLDRPLTDDELEQTVAYCAHDVDATAAVYEQRREYLQSKLTLCDICGEDPLRGLRFSNARLLAEVFHAQPYKFDRGEVYEVPPQIDLSGIPQEVLDYVAGMDCAVATGAVDPGKLAFLFHGVPSVFGIGGIHSADETPYIEESTDGRVLLIQDITSYYPTIILKYGYVSRAIAPECMDLYQHFYDLRVDAKKRGDKQAANAAKLVLNTFSGAMGGKFNKLYDPMMPLGMRITGQLAIMDAVNCAMADAPSARFVQLNTDGWVLSVDRSELQAVLDGVASWEERTGFSVDTQEVRKIIQRDVNNYILEDAEGHVKVKGGTVAQCYGGDFKSNSLVVCQRAVVEHLLHGTPIEDTIDACDDVMQFQLVAKTGSTFDFTEWDYDVSFDVDVEDVTGRRDCARRDRITYTPIVETRRLHMCNRIFAVRNERRGMVYKVKVDGDGAKHRTKVANCPPHAAVVNGSISDISEENRKKLLNSIDRRWYINYSVNKAKAFVKDAIGYGGKIMTEEEAKETVEEPKAAPKRKTTRKTAGKEPEPKKSLAEKALESDPENIAQALYKLQLLMSGNSGSVKFDGLISNINYVYADTQQYKTLLAKCASECGLVFSMGNVEYHFPQMDSAGDNDYIDIVDGNPIDNALNGPSYTAQLKRMQVKDAPAFSRNKQIACMVRAKVSFMFVGDGSSCDYVICGMGVGTQGNSLSIAETNAMRNFITNNFLMDNKGREGDDVATNFMDGLAEKAQKPYVSDTEKAQKKAAIVEEKKQEVVFATLQYAKAMYPKLLKAAELDKAFADKIKSKMSLLYDADGNPVAREDDPERSVMKRAGASELMRKAEAIIAANEE